MFARVLTAGAVALAVFAADPYTPERERMVRETIESRGVRDPAVLRALRATPRHVFVPDAVRDLAYADRPLPIGYGATISQPYIVAVMTELLRPVKSHRVLEIGTGSGYQAAVLAQIVKRVYSIEIVPELAERARETLRRLGHENVSVRCGDGYKGWPEDAPFDSIIVTAAPPEIPTVLVDQLARGGRMIVPVGEGLRQELTVVEKLADGTVKRSSVLPVLFLPMKPAAR